MNRLVLTTCGLILGLSSFDTANAEEPAPAPEPTATENIDEGSEDTGPLFTNSVNVSVFGFLSNNYNFNYEYLMNGTHGFILEPSYSYSSGTDGSYSSYGLNLGYRWHWSEKQNSGFLGLTAGYGLGAGTAEGNGKTFDIDVTSLIFVPNIGYRLAWDFGLNVTFRIGAGYGNYGASTSSTDTDAQIAVAVVDGLLSFLPIALDGELSLGFCF